MRGGIGLVVAVWLLVGALATWQRGYFASSATNCATAGVTECAVPQPSQ